jgi:hypothetical protein
MNDVVLEHLRMGTRDQYESGWAMAADASSVSFTHGLDEVPWVVDVLRSSTSDGKVAESVPSADVTIAKTSTSITITNDVGDGTAYYFKVRAM